MLEHRSGAGIRLGRRASRLLGRALQALEPPQARRHLVSAEETPAHLAVKQSVPRRPVSRLAQMGRGPVLDVPIMPASRAAVFGQVSKIWPLRLDSRG